MSPGCTGCRPSHVRVSVLDAGVEPREGAEPAEASLRLLTRNARDRQVQVPTDDVGDVAEGHPLLGGTVPS
jgi:hypothetical protein